MPSSPAIAATVKNPGLGIRPRSILRTVSTESPAERASASALTPALVRSCRIWEASRRPASRVASEVAGRGIAITILVFVFSRQSDGRASAAARSIRARRHIRAEVADIVSIVHSTAPRTAPSPTPSGRSFYAHRARSPRVLITRSLRRRTAARVDVAARWAGAVVRRPRPVVKPARKLGAKPSGLTTRRRTTPP